MRWNWILRNFEIIFPLRCRRFLLLLLNAVHIARKIYCRFRLILSQILENAIFLVCLASMDSKRKTFNAKIKTVAKTGKSTSLVILNLVKVEISSNLQIY